ncbi:hypothetical protein NOX90_04630 [Wolbachia endosymbiont of Anurida maritima]|uniref:hypothetical protein n=1 Tax=Wolbachia endosymbiont of Anurida maritima TaxID=2850562 RepID=UPI0035D04ADB
MYINFSTVAPERSNSFNNESQDCDDADEISSKSLKIIKKIASNLLLKGGKVRRDLFYHGRIGYATTAFVGNNNSLQFNEYIVAQCKEIENDLKNVAYESIVNKNKQTQKDELEVEIDNGYFYIEYPQDSIIEVIKILNDEKAKDLNLRVGILKIGESTVRVESIGEKRNYTDLADNSDIALTFNTSEGELEVRLYPDMRNKDLIRVEVRSAEAIKNCNEEIGKNCLLGSLSVNEAIEQGYFKKPGKLCQSSETTSPSNKIVEEEKLQRGNNYWQDKEVQRSIEKEEGGKRR